MIEENKIFNEKQCQKDNYSRNWCIDPDYLGGGAVNAFKRVFTNYYIINSSN